MKDSSVGHESYRFPPLPPSFVLHLSYVLYEGLRDFWGLEKKRKNTLSREGVKLCIVCAL